MNSDQVRRFSRPLISANKSVNVTITSSLSLGWHPSHTSFWSSSIDGNWDKSSWINSSSDRPPLWRCSSKWSFKINKPVSPKAPTIDETKFNLACLSADNYNS